MFGAVGDAMVQEWAGVMAWAFPPDSAAVWPTLLAKVRTVAMTGLPTRIVLCMEQDIKAEEQLQSVQGVQLLCSIARGEMPLVDPGAFSRGPLRIRNLRARHAFQIYLIENQAARDRAPVDMSRLIGEIDHVTSYNASSKLFQRLLKLLSRCRFSTTGGCIRGW